MTTSPEARARRSLPCTRCGGALVAAAEFDALRCRHCGTDHLLRERGDVTAVAPNGRIGARRAHGVLLEALRARGIAGANVRERRLGWLPFWHVRAKLVGWQVYHQTVTEPATARGPSGENVPLPTLRDTQRVEELIARDLDVSLPACDTRGWGLAGIGDRIGPLPLRPFSPEREAATSMVAAVIVPRRAAERRAQALRSGGLAPRGARGVRQRLSLVRVRTRLIYYPVWKLRFTVSGEPGEADVDAIRGTVLRGDAPRIGASSAPHWLTAAVTCGWLGGLHPALGGLGLLAFTARRSQLARTGGDPARWIRWFGEELEPRPLVRVPVED